MFPLLSLPTELVELVVSHSPGRFSLVSRGLRSLALPHLFSGTLYLDESYMLPKRSPFTSRRRLLTANPMLARLIRSVELRYVLPPPRHPFEADVFDALTRLRLLRFLRVAVDLGAPDLYAPYIDRRPDNSDVFEGLARLFRVVKNLSRLRSLALELETRGALSALRAPVGLTGLLRLELSWYYDDTIVSSVSPPTGVSPTMTSPTLLAIIVPSLRTLHTLHLRLPSSSRLYVPDLASASLIDLKLDFSDGTECHIYGICNSFPNLTRLALLFGNFEAPLSWRDSLVGQLACLKDLAFLRTNFDLDAPAGDPLPLVPLIKLHGFDEWNTRSLARQQTVSVLIARALPKLEVISWARPVVEECLDDLELDDGDERYSDAYIVRRGGDGRITHQRGTWEDLVLRDES